jgi:SOS-response transcriptional repressor LexA
MTPRQRHALDYISGYDRAHGYPPNYDEIMQELGLRSKSGIYRIVHGLVAGGHVAIRKNCTRSIRILGSAEERLREGLLDIEEMAKRGQREDVNSGIALRRIADIAVKAARAA